jgi:hypothetical protein
MGAPPHSLRLLDSDIRSSQRPQALPGLVGPDYHYGARGAPLGAARPAEGCHSVLLLGSSPEPRRVRRHETQFVGWGPPRTLMKDSLVAAPAGASRTPNPDSQMPTAYVL